MIPADQGHPFWTSHGWQINFYCINKWFFSAHLLQQLVLHNVITTLQIFSTPMSFVFHCAHLAKFQPWVNLAPLILCQPARKHLRVSEEKWTTMMSCLTFILMTIHMKCEIRDALQFYYILLVNPFSYMVNITSFPPFSLSSGGLPISVRK